MVLEEDLPQLLIRNLDEETIAKLKERARLNNRSLQGEVKSLLEEIVSEQPALRKPSFKWMGVLKDEAGKYSSVELQHKILDMWTVEK
jgi:hypothetical protein